MSSRKEQKEQARAERQRREAEAAKAARTRRMRAQLIAGVVAVAVIAGAAIAIASSGGKGSGAQTNAGPSVPLSVAAQQAGCTLINRPAEGHNHVTGNVQYKTNPPSSGDHYPVPASDGEYRQPPTVTHLVHALEHGRVIIWYKPGSPASTVDALRSVFNRDPSLEILTPNNTNMPYEVAASVWTGDRAAANPPAEMGHVLACPKMNPNVPAAIEAFIKQYKGQGPERINTPE